MMTVEQIVQNFGQTGYLQFKLLNEKGKFGD